MGGSDDPMSPTGLHQVELPVPIQAYLRHTPNEHLFHRHVDHGCSSHRLDHLILLCISLRLQGPVRSMVDEATILHWARLRRRFRNVRVHHGLYHNPYACPNGT